LQPDRASIAACGTASSSTRRIAAALSNCRIGEAPDPTIFSPNRTKFIRTATIFLHKFA
jgi:hypothetical protein